jgi:hypothetical protein
VPPWSSTSGWGDSCTPSAIVDYTNACNPSYFEVGAATQQGLWFKSGASCLAQGAVSTQTTYRLGAPIFLDSFPAMTTRTKQVGAATVRETASSTGALLYTEIMDVARDRACYAQRTDDGKARCIPVAELSFADDFADSSCSAPIVRVGYYECTTVLRPRLAQHYLTRALYETGTSKFHGQTFRRFDGVCRPYVESDYYEIVRTVAPSEFPEVTLHEDTLDESSSGGSSNGGSSNGGSSNGLENGSSPGGSSDDGTQGESLSSSSSGDVEIHKVTTGCSTTPAGRSSNGALALVMAMAIGGLVGALVRRRPR